MQLPNFYVNYAQRSAKCYFFYGETEYRLSIRFISDTLVLIAQPLDSKSTDGGFTVEQFDPMRGKTKKLIEGIRRWNGKYLDEAVSIALNEYEALVLQISEEA